MKSLIATGAALLLGLPGIAAAASHTTIQRATSQPIEVQVGGGMTTFVKGLDSETNPGGAWDVRAILLPKSPISVEAAYFGGLSPLAEDPTKQGLMENG